MEGLFLTAGGRGRNFAQFGNSIPETTIYYTSSQDYYILF